MDAVTKRQRAQVVELLRLSAEWLIAWNRQSQTPTTDVGYLLGFDQRVMFHAIAAKNDILPYELRPFDDFDVERLLEASNRVEEGSWP